MPQPQMHDRPAPAPARPSAAPVSYCSIPRRVLTDLHDTPLAIGVYALVARLHLIVRSPVPLSRADVLRFDPSLKAGAVKRAFDRLLAGGWLVQAEQSGHQKHAYTPTWGRIKNAPLPWDLADVCHGRPRHIQRLMVDRNLFDICLGKLVPHAALPATITRYITTPVLSLTDVGCYALTLADIPRPTSALRWLGLIHADQACALPSEQRLLAIISQQTLSFDEDGITPRDTELTLSGTRRIGLAPQTPPNAHDSSAQPLIFVPPSLIGSLIGTLIGSQIGATDKIASDSSTAERAKPALDGPTQSITWESMNTWDIGNPPSTPLHQTNPTGGGTQRSNDQKTSAPRAARAPQPKKPAIPDTAAAQLLHAINVKPAQIAELAELPLASVEAAIADGKARPGIRDLAGWVVSLLRAHRDYGWKITPPAPPSDSPEALRATFAQLAAQQEAARHAGMPDDQPWFLPLAPEPLSLPGATIRLWNDVQAALKHQLARNEFNTWVRRASLSSLEHGVATIMVPTALAQQVLTDRYGPMLRDLLRMYTGQALELRVILNPNAQEQAAADLAPPAARADQAVESTSEVAENSKLKTQNSELNPPDWIAAERWSTLPVMLRAALAGAALVDGEVRGRSPYLNHLIATRFAREVEELLAAAQ